MEINFFSKDGLFKNEISEYSSIWLKDGKRIKNTIERISGLSFSTLLINAEVYEGVSSSDPFKLRASYVEEEKKAAIVHELCHILFRDNHLKAKPVNGDLSLGIHMVIDLVLFDVLSSLWGEEFARKMVAAESSRQETYKASWNWALGFNKTGREKRFENFKLHSAKTS